MHAAFRRAMADIRANRLMSFFTLGTIALAVLIVSTFMLFFINADEVMGAHQRSVRMMAYLPDGLGEQDLDAVQAAIMQLHGVQQLRYISKTQALEELKKQMPHQASLFQSLPENPLPAAFEIRLQAQVRDPKALERIAHQAQGLAAVDEVEYGRQWIDRFVNLYKLFRLAGFSVSGVFGVAAVFIIVNTTRLMLYTRREEVEIMRLVGAAENFIRAPFYLQSILLATGGGLLGLAALFGLYCLLPPEVGQSIGIGFFQVRFLSPVVLAAILLASMTMGLLGSFLSMKQYFK